MGKIFCCCKFWSLTRFGDFFQIFSVTRFGEDDLFLDFQPQDSGSFFWIFSLTRFGEVLFEIFSLTRFGEDDLVH